MRHGSKSSPGEDMPRAGWVPLALVLAVFSAGCNFSPEARGKKHMEGGKVSLAKKDYRTAIIEFKVASQNLPKDPEPLYQLGMTYLVAGAGRQALEAFQKAVTVNPKHEGAQFQVALFEVGSNKPEQVEAAKHVLEKYSATHVEDGESVGAIALAEAKLGNKETAVNLLKTAVTRAPGQLRPAAMMVALYAAKGDVSTATRIARDVANQLPNSPDAAVLRAQVSLATQDLPDADAQISRALALKPGFSPALALRLRRELMLNDRQGAEDTTRELSKLPEKQAWATYARMLFAEKKYDESAKEFERVLKERGDPAEIRDEYSGMMLTAGKRKEAKVIVAATLAKNPKDKIALLQHLTLAIDAGDLNGATKDIKQLIELKGLSPMLTYQQSRLAGARGDAVRQGDLLADALKSNPRLLAARLDLAQLLTASGKGRNAVAILDAANPMEKATAEYLFNRNMALITSGEWDQARKGVDTALGVARFPGFLYQDGLLKARSGDMAGARKSAEESFHLDPNNPLTLKLLADIMRKSGEGQKFVGMVREATGKNPSSVSLQNALAGELALLGDLNGARTAYLAAKAAGDTPAADTAIAQLDLQSGALDTAKTNLTELIKTRDNAPARLLLAEIEMRKGSSSNAVSHYLKAMAMQPNNVPAMNNLAELLAENPKTSTDAVFWAQKALALVPDNPIVEDTLGWIYFRQGKLADASPLLEKSLRGLDRPVAHYHMAGMLMKRGDAAGARKEYDLGVKMDPKSPARAAVSLLFEGK